MADLKSLMLKKQKDYGPRNITDFGELGILIRANDKIARLKNLRFSGRTAVNESVDDSWMDLANYGIIALMLRRGVFDLPLADCIKQKEVQLHEADHPVTDRRHPAP